MKNLFFLFTLVFVPAMGFIACNSPAETSAVTKAGFELSEAGKAEQYKKVTACTPETRDAEVCPSIYQPVCATLQNGQKKTFANSCQACLKKEVTSWQVTSCEDRAKK